MRMRREKNAKAKTAWTTLEFQGRIALHDFLDDVFGRHSGADCSTVKQGRSSITNLCLKLSGRQRNSRFGHNNPERVSIRLSCQVNRTLSSLSTRRGRLRHRRNSAAQSPASLTSRPDLVPARKRTRPSTTRAVANCHGPRRVLSGSGHAAQKSLIERIFIHLERLSSPSMSVSNRSSEAFVSRTNRDRTSLKPTGAPFTTASTQCAESRLCRFGLTARLRRRKRHGSRRIQGVRNHAISLSQTDEHRQLFFCRVRLHIKMKPDIL